MKPLLGHVTYGHINSKDEIISRPTQTTFLREMGACNAAAKIRG